MFLGLNHVSNNNSKGRSFCVHFICFGNTKGPSPCVPRELYRPDTSHIVLVGIRVAALGNAAEPAALGPGKVRELVGPVVPAATQMDRPRVFWTVPVCFPCV